MSLSRILNNDEPYAPPAPTFSEPSSSSLPHQASPKPNSSNSHSHLSRNDPYSEHKHSRTYSYQPNYDSGQWDYSPEGWPSHPASSSDQNGAMAPSYSRNFSYRHPEGDSRDFPLKSNVSPYASPDITRSSPTKVASRAEMHNSDTLIRQKSPVHHFLPDSDADSRPSRHITEEERLVSSDLDDCEEIWGTDLAEYKLDTEKRRQHVFQYFNENVKKRTSITARNLSHHYSDMVTRMPVAPLSPPPLVSSRLLEDMPVHSDSTPRSYYTYDERDLSIPRLPNASRSRKDNKRPITEFVSQVDIEVPVKQEKGPVAKKRRIEQPVPGEITMDGFDPILALPTNASISKGKGRARDTPIFSAPAAAPDPAKVAKRKPVPKKKPPLASVSSPAPDHPHFPVLSVIDDVISTSRAASPTPTVTTVIYELDEDAPALRLSKRVDDATLLKRIKTMEEMQKKVWTAIARRDVAKVHKLRLAGFQARQSQAERVAKLASIQARRPVTKTAKMIKDTQLKAKRLSREMQAFWKKNEKEEKDLRKREQKEAMDRIKMEEEKREAARQGRKLEFLISQTELYSHFVGSKIKTAETEGEEEQPMDLPIGADVEIGPNDGLQEIDFDDEDKTNLYRHAKYNAQEAIDKARSRALEFDIQVAADRKAIEAKSAKNESNNIDEQDLPAKGQDGMLVDLDSEELNFQNPTSLSGPLKITQPKLLTAQLKEYQVKGLNWLATLYEQGINGILADEMGLGKTIQSISLLAYLAETHDIWGPFLVIAPASTLHNWQQELSKFVPTLKALPYWGNVKDRTTLRKFWSRKDLSYNQDAPFHVLITSYQLVIQDQQYFQKVKWQYMILDEAQNIKNSSSARWKTLLNFHCRNRLLLTGTPIQNSMQELWSLLHFIMPSLFDSHDEFNEWFSKDIENAAENKGGKMNEHQLRRLHMILKPFMLRRVKKHVQNELSEKIEHDIYVDLSARQRALYKVLRSKVSVADLLAKAANFNDADTARTLMNLVMQFRKVCNHPELFEVADVVAPFSFSCFRRSKLNPKDNDLIYFPYSCRNPIEYSLPSIFYREGGLMSIPSESSSYQIPHMFDIWSTDWLHRSTYENYSPTFSFLYFLGISSYEAHSFHISPLIKRRLISTFPTSPSRLMSSFSIFDVLKDTDIADGYPHLTEISTTVWSYSCLSRPSLKCYIPPVIAPPIAFHCSDRSFLSLDQRIREAPLETLALYGMPPTLSDSEDAFAQYQSLLPHIPPNGLLGASSPDQIPTSRMLVPEARRLIYDSAKLARLDLLLQELKAGDHRVLIYFQMTRMMDLMEEYLVYRQYKYLRLDGSSKLEDRRDMVNDWQSKNDIFIFLLSTRAGGLGINLTAADTVIFYDHDWNPSNDAQAMDRAHRLGQTRQVTVYRLITRGTIDERIVQLARVKKDVQDIVVGNKTLTDVAKPNDIVQLLLNDEQLTNLDTTEPAPSKALASSKHQTVPGLDFWNDDDDFFGNTADTASVSNDMEGENETVRTTSTRGRKKKGMTTGTRGGRKTAGKRRGGAPSASADLGDV